MMFLHGRTIRSIGTVRTVLLCLFLSAISASVYAVPANPRPFTATQPDGSEFTLRIVGDEFISWRVTEDGYTVVKAQDGFYYYAQKDTEGKLVETQYKVGQADPETVGIIKGIRPDVSQAAQAQGAFNAAAKAAAADFVAKAQAGNGGSVYKQLVLLVAFNDHYDSKNRTVLDAYGHSREKFDAIFNYNTIDNGPDPYGVAPGGSVRDYWVFNTYGKVVVESTVVDWIKLPYDAQEYYDLGVAEGNGTAMLNIINQAWTRLLGKISSGEIVLDVSQFDKLTVVRSGWGEEAGAPGMIWAHAMMPAELKFSEILPGFTGNDKIGNYATIAALSGASGTNMTQIGVIVHELGHSLLGLPDLYDTGDFEDARTDVNPIYTNGIGDWCIMSGGSWGLGGSAAFPSHVCGPLKYKFDIIEPVVLNRESDSSAEDAEGRRIHDTNIGRVAPDPLTEDGWGSYEINAGSVDADAYYLVDLEPHSLVVRTQVDNANDLDSAAGIFKHTQLLTDTDSRWVERWNDADRHVIPRDSIAFIGGADGRGIFRGGLKSGLPFDAGIFLSTGSAARAAGPNASENMSTDNGAGARSIAALDTLLRPMTMKEGKIEPLSNNDGYDRATTNAAGFSFDLLGSRKKISFDCVVATDAESTSDKNDIIAVIVDDKYGWLITRDELMERNEYSTALLKYDLDTDVDKDGIYDPEDPNVSLEDMDGDGIHDLLDPDKDGDGILDLPIYGDDGKPVYPGEDLNGNGLLDEGEDTDKDGLLYVNEDADGSGSAFDPNEDTNNNKIIDIGDMEISFKDTDKDGIHDDLELDVDGDGILDEESTVDEDTNANGRLDFGEDTNKNGLLDLKTGDTELEFLDTDFDGIHNNIDMDVDGDLLFDAGKESMLDPALFTAANGKLPNGDINENGKFDFSDILISEDVRLVYINEDLDGSGGDKPDIPEPTEGDDTEEDKGEDFYTNGKLDYGDPDIVFKDDDGDGNHDDIMDLFSPHSFEGVETKYLKNGINDNRRDSNPPAYRANGRTAYNNEFDMFTTEMKIELDLNDLKPLFWEQPSTDEEPSEDSMPVFLNRDKSWFGFEKFELGENGEDEFVKSMEERFQAFLKQDYHNIKIVVADFTNNGELNNQNIGQRSTGDTALFIDFGTIVTGDDISKSAGKYHEYLLIENRQQSKPFGAAGPGYEGFEVNMPGNGGLAIWHIDESVQWVNSVAGYPGLGDYPWDGRHHEVALVQADNRFDLEANMNGADAGDLFAAPGNNVFNAFTPQNTDAYKYGCVAKSYASISNISESADIMSFVFMETGVYNDSIARPLSINEFAEFADQGSSSWWVGSGNYTDSWWKYIPPSLSGMNSLNLPARPVNHPRLSANYAPGSYRIYGDTQYAVESWIPNDMDVYRWEYGSPCSGYDWINTPYDAIGDNKKPIDSIGLWYTLTAEKTGFVHMSTCSSGFDTTLAVFAEPNDVYNANKNFFTTNFLACNDDSMVSDPECFYSSELDVYMEKGHEYLIRVGGYNYESGDFDLFINYCDLAANDQPAGAVNLMLNSPVAGNIIGASGTDITADVNGDMLDLWYMFTPAADGDYRVAACTSEFDSTLAVYMGEVNETGDTMVAFNDDLEQEQVLASTGCGPLSSHVSVTMVEGVTYYIRVAGSVDSYGEFTVEVTNRPINDEKANAIPVMDFGTYNESYSGSTVNATASLDQDGDFIRTDCNSEDGSIYDVWYVYVPRYDAEVTVSLKDSKFDTVLAIYQGDTLVTCNDDTYYYSQWSQQSELVTPMEAGKKYYIRVSGWGQDVGNYTLKVTGGEGDGTSALEIVCPDTIELVDASGTGDGFRAGQSVDIRIAAAGGRPDPATGKYRNWSINIPAGNTGNYDFVTSQFVNPAGDGLNVNANDSIIAYTLPFGFPFYSTNYTQIGISTNGFIRLGSGVSSLPLNSEQALKNNKVIAPLWDDYKLNAAAFDMFVAQDNDKVVITWVAEFVGDGVGVGDTCKFSATLFKNGNIRFDYGSMLKTDGSAFTTTPTVGISNGNGIDYHYISSYSFDLNNDNADDNVRVGLSQAQGIVFTGNQHSPDMLPKGLEAKIDQDGIRITGTIQEEYPANEDGAPNFVVEITVSDYDNPATTVIKQLAMVMIEEFDSAVFESIMTNWMSAGCADDNWCDKGDLNGDGRVDLRDFAIYALFGADYQ